MTSEIPLRDELVGFGHMPPQTNWRVDAHVYEDYY